MFLNDQKQHVKVNNSESEEKPVISGVPQGSVLGPMLFLTHINDLPAAVQSQCRLFADDCLLYRPIRKPQDQLTLQDDLDSLQRWAED